MSTLQVPVLGKPDLAAGDSSVAHGPAGSIARSFDVARAALSGLLARRAALGLPQPGTIENINKEVSKDVFLARYAFTGLRAEVSKSFSLNPAFQVAHTLSMGSQMMAPYSFTAFYATDNAFLQGNIDSDLALSGRVHASWNPAQTTKAEFQISQGQPAMLQLEHDCLGSDFSLNMKTLNPSLLSGGLTGVFVGSLLQSVTKNLALGMEAVYSSQSPLYPPDAAVSYMGRYATPSWVASLQLQATGSVVGSFWRKVADKVEAGIETTIGMGNPQAIMMGGAPTLEGTTTVGAKYEFRQSIFRGQIDSQGKVACTVERRILPVVGVTFSGEIDHFKSQAKLGMGLQLEAGGDEVFEQQQQLMEQQAAAQQL